MECPPGWSGRNSTLEIIGTPRLIGFSSFGDTSAGVLTVAHLTRDIPFDVRRVFWTYGTPTDRTRGGHAHYVTEAVLVAVSGGITVSTELPGGDQGEFVLDSPAYGLYLPPLCWRTMRYSASAVQVTFESHDYVEEDYIHRLDDLRGMVDEASRKR
jgi:hypothetical protein